MAWARIFVPCLLYSEACAKTAAYRQIHRLSGVTRWAFMCCPRAEAKKIPGIHMEAGERNSSDRRVLRNLTLMKLEAATQESGHCQQARTHQGNRTRLWNGVCLDLTARYMPALHNDVRTNGLACVVARITEARGRTHDIEGPLEVGTQSFGIQRERTNQNVA